MLWFPMISQWACHRPKKARNRRSSGPCPPRTGPSAKLADGPASAIRNSNGTSDPWHAPQLRTTQNGRRARLHDVGGQKERWRAHCWHVLPRVSDHPKSSSRKAPLRSVCWHVTGSQPRLRETRNMWWYSRFRLSARLLWNDCDSRKPLLSANLRRAIEMGMSWSSHSSRENTSSPPPGGRGYLITNPKRSFHWGCYVYGLGRVLRFLPTPGVLRGRTINLVSCPCWTTYCPWRVFGSLFSLWSIASLNVSRKEIWRQIWEGREESVIWLKAWAAFLSVLLALPLYRSCVSLTSFCYYSDAKMDQSQSNCLHRLLDNRWRSWFWAVLSSPLHRWSTTRTPAVPRQAPSPTHPLPFLPSLPPARLPSAFFPPAPP